MFPSEYDDFRQNVDRIDSQILTISSTTTVPTLTTRSSRFWRCMASCPTTSEYNPVCGTDNLSYHNRQKLDCTNICGRKLDQNWNGIYIISDFLAYILFFIY